ncbi:type II toxin-antitoxin system HicA family toxin [Clostridium perfringens]|uniref:Type II toxin-antitoxin system HicA family toxin n=1 Tax=Clostridium perfringens TaxID=1502 RepID=A0A6G4ZD58_CLOPF|nr:type II toxin-antitoxin system HicA family toxin [Clostridium perfringens]MCX0385639.1 type II toxin-antitoxin system HicA family toxin [Clostridium perfringens]MDK0700553.1 type II toxin-antitoxin system HicA family toxin [Clostridium perfringens]MDK0765211.1 type II toxin-antitoxin system HicA family toxin [Clostridium perfringens]MDM0858723.1 type II toxin-antitoxin system HicA family toxin [Clostridium perfringens]MDM0882333.1 type II toxin-antitoxin system HicA family toxin [Clostridiu
MTSKKLIKLLKSYGWELKNQRGSHVHLVHKSKKGKLTIPEHRGDLKPKTLDSILKQAGLK